MKKTLFIMTHLGSGWEKLAERLERDPRIHVFNTGRGYHHPEDVRTLTSQIHRRDNSAAIWADVVLFNKDFTMKRLSKHYNFIFWSREYEETLHDLLTTHRYGDEQAESYYGFRLDGMKQYWMRRQASKWNPNLEDDLLFETIL